MTKHLIQVLGAGCTKCTKLADAAARAAEELSLDYELEKVTDILRFSDFGVMVTPALVVDGQVVVAGKVPSFAELQELLPKDGESGR